MKPFQLNLFNAGSDKSWPQFSFGELDVERAPEDTLHVDFMLCKLHHRVSPPGQTKAAVLELINNARDMRSARWYKKPSRLSTWIIADGRGSIE